MLHNFYQAVLPQSGHYCLLKLPARTHVWAESTEELAELTLEFGTEDGVYFAVESFKSPENRTQANVLALCSLRLDVDAGADKFSRDPQHVYETRELALKAITVFIKDSGIKPSFLVSSGEGWHIYYCLTEDLTPEDWKPLATALGRVARASGLLIDPTVTSDTARVLRPLGTTHKNGNLVSLVADTGSRYEPAALALALGAVPEAAERVFNMDVNADLGLTVEGPPKSIHKILQHCGAMQEINAVKGDVQEPFWRAMLGVVKFTVEGVEAAQMLSTGHPDYDEVSTERKFNAWATGPTTCAELGKHTNACMGCEYRGKVKSPILLGYLNPEQVEALPPDQQPAPARPPAPTGDPWDGMIPAKFSVQKGLINTLVHKMIVETESADGDTVQSEILVPFTNDIFWLGQWAEALATEDNALVTLHLLSNGRVKTYVLDQSLIASRSDLLRYLAGKAIHLTSNKRAPAAMSQFILSMLHGIKTSNHRDKINDRMGLRILENGDMVCAHGKYYITSSGEIQIAMLGKSLESVANRFPLPLPPTSNGTWGKEVWATTLVPASRQYRDFVKNYYDAPGLEKYQLAIMLGLCSPLMAFITGAYTRGIDLPANGFSVSLFSRETGRGKTAVVQTIMMAYGNKSVLVKDSNSSGSTDIARSSKLSLWGTMPMSMDEMGDTKETSISSMVNMVGNGASRERATKDGDLVVKAPWALINMITTNRSQRDMIAAVGTDSTAIQNRLMELNVDNIKKFDSKQGGNLDNYDIGSAAIDRDCAGAFGAVLEYWICKQGQAKMNELVMHNVIKARQLLGDAEQGARYQYRVLGAMLCLQAFCERMGLAMFDTDTLIREFKLAFDAGNEFIKDTHTPTSGPELMTMMLASCANRTLVTEAETHQGHSRGHFDMALNLRAPDKPIARHVISSGFTYVSTGAFRDWCAENKVSEREIITECRRSEILVPFKNATGDTKDHFTEYYNFHKGMKDNADARSRCMKVDTRRMLRSIGADWDRVLPDTDGKVISMARATIETPAPDASSEVAAA